MKVLTMQTEEEWLAARKNGIGASEAGAVCGLNDWAGPLTVWTNKQPDAEPKPDTKQMRAGRVLEDVVAHHYEQEKTRDTLRPTQLDGIEANYVIYQHEEHPWMLATLDRWAVEAGISPMPLEIKTNSVFEMGKWERNGIPQTYYAQVQQQLAVTERDEAQLSALFLPNEAYDLIDRLVEMAEGMGADPMPMLIDASESWPRLTFDIERNQTFIDQLIETEAAFWDQVKRGVRPSVSPNDNASELLKRLFPKAEEGRVCEVTASQLANLYQAQDQAKAAAAELERIKNEIQLTMGPAEVLEFEGIPVATWKNRVRNNKAREASVSHYRQFELARKRAAISQDHIHQGEVL